MSKPTLPRSLANASLWLYPRAWRERYADEVRDIVAARDVTLLDALGLLWRGGVERVIGRAPTKVDWGLPATAGRFVEGLVAGSLTTGVVTGGMLVTGLTTAVLGAALGAWEWRFLYDFSGLVQLVPVAVLNFLPTALLIAWPGFVLGLLVGPRWPMAARVVFVSNLCAFLAFTGLVTLVPVALAGWVFAAGLWPLEPAVRPSVLV